MNYPEWYDYYDTRFGTAGLLNLPDIRGQKERNYILANAREVSKKMALQKAQQPPKFTKPRLSKSTYHTEYLEWFIDRFENAQTKKYYEEDKRFRRVTDQADNIMQDVELLLKSGETLPIEAHYDWTEAIEQTVNRYKISRIIAFLPHTYEQYKLKNEINLFPYDNFIASMREDSVRRILDGRELLGEPRNLDF